MGTKSRAARPSARRHIVCQAAGRSSVESFYWTLRLSFMIVGWKRCHEGNSLHSFFLTHEANLLCGFGSSFVEFGILISLKSQLIELMQLHKSFFSLVPIGVLLSVRNAHRASSSFLDHIDGLSLTVFLRILFKALSVFSTLPLVCGWPDLSKSVDLNTLFDIAGRILLLGRTEFCLVTGFACEKVVFPKYLDDGILLFVRRLFSDKLKKLEKNKTGLEEAAKGKATQPSDKSDKDSVTIGHLGELVTYKAEKGKAAQPSDKGDKVSVTIRDLDGRGATDGAKVSGEAMNDVDMSAVAHVE
nr:hypothetical protein [Tanacetum cinerariifolium]